MSDENITNFIAHDKDTVYSDIQNIQDQQLEIEISKDLQV